MFDENIGDENEGRIEIPSRNNRRNADSENEEMNLSEDDDLTQNLPISQQPLKEEPDMKDFRPLDKADKNKLKFSYLTKFFQKYSEMKGRKKSDFLSTFLNEYLFKHDRSNAYSVFRLIIPEQDRERNTYGLKETNLGRLLTEAFSLPASEANRLKYYKNPNYQPFGAPDKKTGDFPNVAYSVVKGLCRQESTLTVGEINEYLDELASQEDNKDRVKVMIKIIQKISGEDIKWICKIILKDIRIGLSHERLLTCYHPEALDLFNVTSNLREVCNEFIDIKHTLSNVLRLFHPVKPMLAGRRNIDDIKRLLFGKTVSIEIKYDGERIQCHFNREQLKFFTRNSNDYTHIYGPKLSDVVRSHIKAQSVILDGEIIVLNKHTSQMEAFGANKSVAINQGESDLQLCYKIFDILYVKSEQGEECNLMSLKLSDRKKVLKRIVIQEKNLIELGEHYETSNLDEISTYFEQAISRNEEGVIVKQTDSFYVPKERSTSWLKLKGDYVEGIVDTLDVLVIGGYYGEGSRVGKFGSDDTENLTHFLMAISKKVDKENPINSLFIPFCKIGTGYKIFELESLRTKLKNHLIKYDPRIKPRYLVNWNPTVTDKPDYIIDNPSNSIILEVKAAEFIRSTSFPCDYTLRFPRVIKIRYDKDWHECMTYEEMLKMIYDSEKALRNIKKKKRKNSGHSDGEEEKKENEGEAGSKKRVKTNAKELNVLAQYRDTDVSSVNVISDLFKNCEFYIVNNDSNFISKATLEEQIVKYGGTKVQNFLFTNTHIIASYSDFKLEAILKKYPCNILYPKWVTDSIKANALQDFAPKYLLHSVPWLKKRNEELYDIYGDSYILDTNATSLREFLNEMENDKEIFQEDDNLKHLKKKLKDKIIVETPVFEETIIYMMPQKEDFQRKFLKFKIAFNGGKIIESLTGNIDYILEDKFSQEQIEAIKKYRQKNKNVRIVNEAFFLDILEKTHKSFY